MKVQSLELGNKHNYKIYKITNGRLYTDRVHDTAIILDNSIVSGPSFQLRDNKKWSAERNMIFEKGTTRIIKKEGQDTFTFNRRRRKR